MIAPVDACLIFLDFDFLNGFDTGHCHDRGVYYDCGYDCDCDAVVDHYPYVGEDFSFVMSYDSVDGLD